MLKRVPPPLTPRTAPEEIRRPELLFDTRKLCGLIIKCVRRAAFATASATATAVDFYCCGNCQMELEWVGHVLCGHSGAASLRCGFDSVSKDYSTATRTGCPKVIGL